MTDLVAAGAAAVDYDAWTTTENGEQIAQITTETTIHDMLRLLDLRPGMRVLEVGTGSGYSGALLSHIVGANGHVVSVDIDAGLVDRAAARHERTGHTNIELRAADGFRGWASAGPFDRIVGWVTPHVLPTAWVEQAKPATVIVTPVKIADVAGTNAVVRCVIDNGGPGGIHDGELHPGSFIEMAPEVITELGQPIRYVNAVRRHQDGAPWWLSGHQLHDRPPAIAENLLGRLIDAEPEREFFTWGREHWRNFTTFVLASTTSPASVGGAHGWGIGTARPDSVAVSLSNGALLAAGATDARNDLAAMLTEWHDLGEPHLADHKPSFTPSDDGWAVRPQLRSRV